MRVVSQKGQGEKKEEDGDEGMAQATPQEVT